MLTILSFLRETPDPQAGQIPALFSAHRAGLGLFGGGRHDGGVCRLFLCMGAAGSLGLLCVLGLEQGRVQHLRQALHGQEGEVLLHLVEIGRASCRERV